MRQPSTPETFRGFAFCIAAVLAGYLSLIGALGYSIKQSLDEVSIVSMKQRRVDFSEATGSIGAARAHRSSSTAVGDQ